MNKLTVFVLAVIVFTVTRADARTWVDRTGQRTIEAEFVSLTGNQVKLRKADGGFITLAIDKFCESDRQRIRRLAADQGPAPGDHNIKADVRAVWSPIVMKRNGIELPKLLEVYVDLAGSEAEAASHYGPVKLTTADCGGKDLLRMKDPFGRAAPQSGKPIKVKRDAFNKHVPGGLSIKLLFQNPGNAFKVSAIEGTAMIRTGGNKSNIRIRGVAEAKRFPLSRELANIGVSVSLKKSPTEIRFDVVKGADKVAGMQLVDELGDEYQNISASQGETDGVPYYSFNYNGKLFRDAILKIAVVTGARELEIPFSARDIQIK